MNISNYGYGKKVDASFEQAIEMTKESLKHQGFGVLTEIDMKATLKKKIDKNINKYVILGACHPTSAYKAVQSEIEIGLMLPCNVIVYEYDNAIFVSAIKPKVAMAMIDNDDLREVAIDIEDRLTTVINNL